MMSLLPSYTETLRSDLASTPGIDRIFVGRDWTFFISGEVKETVDGTELLGVLNRLRQTTGLAELAIRLSVVRTMPGANGGTYYEAYARPLRPLF
jgi:hypothetical protein